MPNILFENNFFGIHFSEKYEYVYFRLELFVGSLHKSCWPRKNGLSITTVTKFISSWKKCGLTWGISSHFEN